MLAGMLIRLASFIVVLLLTPWLVDAQLINTDCSPRQDWYGESSKVSAGQFTATIIQDLYCFSLFVEIDGPKGIETYVVLNYQSDGWTIPLLSERGQLAVWAHYGGDPLGFYAVYGDIAKPGFGCIGLGSGWHAPCEKEPMYEKYGYLAPYILGYEVGGYWPYAETINSSGLVTAWIGSPGATLTYNEWQLPTPVPEPGSAILPGTALATLMLWRKAQSKRRMRCPSRG
jgi:hypothetical protein